MRKAKSLLCLHLSGNPGLTIEVQEWVTKRIRCRPNEDMERFTRIQNAVKKVQKSLPKTTKLEAVQHMIDRHQDFNQYKKDPTSVTDKFLL